MQQQFIIAQIRDLGNIEEFTLATRSFAINTPLDRYLIWLMNTIAWGQVGENYFTKLYEMGLNSDSIELEEFSKSLWRENLRGGEEYDHLQITYIGKSLITRHKHLKDYILAHGMSSDLLKILCINTFNDEAYYIEQGDTEYCFMYNFIKVMPDVDTPDNISSEQLTMSYEFIDQFFKKYEDLSKITLEKFFEDIHFYNNN